ncbi:hypothetical protein ONZ45_g7419 [Pleurotus djamor]|nr:hypothetical protein ONZ45_g7419 [Pleurotus djamor]
MSSSTSQEGSAMSLLSLSIAAESAAPIPIRTSTAEDSLSKSVGNGVAGSASSSPKQHRRLASMGKTRRRMSDARDAAARPSTTVALSLASLSLSTSASGDPGLPSPTTSAADASNALSDTHHYGHDAEAPLSSSVPEHLNNPLAAPIAINKNGKKRGMDYKCESCSKIYRHPSCLIKHRWEHTPQWREASKFVLSKHQQVQLLEAAAILSHMSPTATGTSLPDDRSLWPAFLSGSIPQAPQTSEATSASPSRPVSSSVPANSILSSSTRAGSTGPRLHNYSIPASSATGGGSITQVRPGLVGVTTQPVPVPTSSNTTAYRTVSGSSDSVSWGSGYGIGHGRHGSSQPYYTRSMSRDAGGQWALPGSSLRSGSRSASGSGDDEDSIEVDVDGFALPTRAWKREEDEFSVGFSVKEEDDEEKKGWDGMEMEMDMD